MYGPRHKSRLGAVGEEVSIIITSCRTGNHGNSGLATVRDGELVPCSDISIRAIVRPSSSPKKKKKGTASICE